MSALKLAVLRQVAYAHSVRRFIREILKVLIPGKWIDRVICESDAAFDAKLDAAFATIDESTATKDDYCRKVVNVLCDEVARLCEVLREVCEGSGYGDYARCYISHEKFVRLLLRTDTVKLGRLKKALAERRESPTDLLREIGAILDDRSLEETAALDAAERRRANAALKAIAADVKKTIAKIDAVGEKVDAIAAKVKRGRRRGKYDAETVAFCMACVDAAKSNAEVRNSSKTKMTLKAVYTYHRRKLESCGVEDFAEFSKIVHAYRARESRDRVKKLEARQKTAAQSNTRRGKNDILHTMRNAAKSALALTLAIAGGLASPLRSAASPDILRGGGASSWQGCVAALYARPSALPEPARAEIRGRVVKVADGDTITILDAANAQHKIRLYGIDAPEKSQAFGQKSKQHLSSLVFGKDVAVKWKSKDRYGRILGTVFVDGKDINLAMLQEGLAWHYKRYDNSPAYAAAETEARQNRRGLWSDPNSIPPEQFRHGKTAAPSALPRSSAGGPRVEYRAGNAMPVGSRTAAPINDTWPDTGFWLSTNSNKRHNRKCENYRKTRGYPCSKDEGIPCKKCGG